MCILSPRTLKRNHMKPWRKHLPLLVTVLLSGCLLYTSDAADERSSVDLGGRRIIKKTKYETDGE